MSKLRLIALSCFWISVGQALAISHQPASSSWDPLQVKTHLDEISHQVRKSLHRLTRKAYISYLGLRPEDLLQDQEVLGDVDTLFDDLNHLLQKEIEPLVQEGRQLSALYSEKVGDRRYLDQFEFYHYRIQGIMLSNSENYLKGRESLLAAVNRAERLRDREGMAYVLNNLSYCNFQIGEIEEATANLQQAIGIAEKAEDSPALGLFLYNLGWVHVNAQRAEAAVPFFKRAAELSQSLSLPIREVAALNNLGSIYLSQGEWEKAKTCFVQSLDISRELNSLRFRAMSAFNYAAILAREEQYQRAAHLLDEVLSIYEDHGRTAFMDSEGAILQHKALRLLQFINTQARQQIVSPYLESGIEQQKFVLKGPIHSHFSHLFRPAVSTPDSKGVSPTLLQTTGKEAQIQVSMEAVAARVGTSFKIPVHLASSPDWRLLSLTFQVGYPKGSLLFSQAKKGLSLQSKNFQVEERTFSEKELEVTQIRVSTVRKDAAESELPNGLILYLQFVVPETAGDPFITLQNKVVAAETIDGKSLDRTRLVTEKQTITLEVDRTP